MTYSPLPPYLTIRPSEIHGLGLFATEDIADGADMGVSHIWPTGFEKGWIRTPLGGFYNHSEEPNCESEMLYGSDGSVRILIALRPIKAGEEITCKYTLKEYEGKL